MKETEFVKLINDNINVIHRACNNYFKYADRDDIVQDIIIEAWLSFDFYEKRSNFKTWLYTIARNVCVSKLRKKLQEPYFEDADLYAQSVCCEQPKFEILHASDVIRYRNVIRKIDKKYKKAFGMYLRGANYEKISKATGLNGNLLRVRIHRIKQELQDRYKHLGWLFYNN